MKSHLQSLRAAVGRESITVVAGTMASGVYTYDLATTLLVKPGVRLKILSLVVQFTTVTGATVRKLRAGVYDSDNSVWLQMGQSACDQSASNIRYYVFAPGVSQSAAFSGVTGSGMAYCPWHPTWLSDDEVGGATGIRFEGGYSASDTLIAAISYATEG